MEALSRIMFEQTINYEHDLIWVKPVCELFQLHVQNQYEKIQKDPILGKLWIKNHTDLQKPDKKGIISGNLYGKNHTDLVKKEPFSSKLVGKNTPDLGEIDENGRILLSKTGFLRWIQIINANTIVAPLRAKFIQYQTLIFDFMYEPMFNRKSLLKEKAQLSSRIDEKRDILNENKDYMDLISLQAEEMRLGKLLKDIDRDVVAAQKSLWDQDFINSSTSV